METPKTLVYNKTEVGLKLTADLKEIWVGAGETKAIDFGSQQIYVVRADSDDEKPVRVDLNRYEFPRDTDLLLVFQMLHLSLHYTFHRWTWSTLRHTELDLLLQRQRRSVKLKTRIDNKTGLDLRFRDFYVRRAGEQGYYGSVVLGVGPFGRTKICSGIFLRAHNFETAKEGRRNYSQVIHVSIAGAGEIVLVLTSDEFQNNDGKDLLLDSQHNRFGYAFLRPQTTSWKNWLCFSQTHKSGDMKIFD